MQMKLTSILFALSLLLGCGASSLASIDQASLGNYVVRSVEDVLDETCTGIRSSSQTTRAQSYDFHCQAPISEREMMNKVAALRDLLQEKLTQAGGKIHGNDISGTLEAMSGFHIDYTTSTEEGLVWVRSTDNGEGESSVFVVWHGVRIN